MKRRDAGKLLMLGGAGAALAGSHIPILGQSSCYWPDCWPPENYPFPPGLDSPLPIYPPYPPPVGAINMHNLVTLSSWAAWEEPGFPDGYNTSLCNGILKTVNGYMSYAGSVWTQSEVTHTLTDQQVYTVVEQAWALSS